jgi:hypothetical protein
MTTLTQASHFPSPMREHQIVPNSQVGSIGNYQSGTASPVTAQHESGFTEREKTRPITDQSKT